MVVLPPSSRAMANRMLSWKTRSLVAFMMRSMTRSEAPSLSRWHCTSARPISPRLRVPGPPRPGIHAGVGSGLRTALILRSSNQRPLKELHDMASHSRNHAHTHSHTPDGVVNQATTRQSGAARARCLAQGHLATTGIELATFRFPANLLYLLRHMPPRSTVNGRGAVRFMGTGLDRVGIRIILSIVNIPSVTLTSRWPIFYWLHLLP